jgi:predicted SnoaL-like aldol condensation-catalyzing enzyme
MQAGLTDSVSCLTIVRMKIRTAVLALAVPFLFSVAVPVFAQEPVVGVADPEALFHSKDKKLDRNLQAAYHIELDLLECNHWDEAGKWLTEAYHQHNPLAASGREGVVAFFKARGVQPTPIPAKMKTKIVAVLADGDYVVVVTPRGPTPDPRDPSKSYYTTWFDMWRFVDGKADEHWDPQTIPPPNPNARGKK